MDLTVTDQPPRGSGVDAALRATDAAGRYLAQLEVSRALDQLSEDIVSTGAEPTRAAGRRARTQSRVSALVVFCTVAVVGGGAALAEQYSTHTGLFGPPGQTENDTSEYLRTDAPGFLTYARQLTAHIRFAPGDSAENYFWLFQVKSPDGRPAMVQVTGVRGVIADAASCSWQRAWIAAHAARNAGGMSAAAVALHRAAGSEDLRRINQGPWTAQLAVAADAGNPAPLELNVSLNCPAAKPASLQ